MLQDDERGSVPSECGRTILRRAAEYQNRLWVENQDFDAYRAYSLLIWVYLAAAPEEEYESSSFV